MQEKEIDLVDLMVEILLKWRIFILWALCGAIVFGAFSYIKTWRTANAQAAEVEAAKRKLEDGIQESSAAVNAELLEKAASQLTDAQRRNVGIVVGYEKWLINQEDSVLLQINPNNVYQAEITYYITSESREQSYSIEAVYEDIVSSGEIVQYIANRLGTSPYISDLITLQEKELMQRTYSIQESNTQASVLEQEPSDSFSIRVMHYDEQTCDELTQAVVDFVENKHAELADKLGEHGITAVNISRAVVRDSGLADAQRILLSNITTMHDAVLKRKNDFVNLEWQYYDILTNGEITGITSTNSVVLSPSDIVERGVTVTPGLSLKYLLLGIVMAMFLYALYIFMTYIFSPTIRATDNLQQLYAVSQLGLVPAKKNKKKIFEFVDRWIESLRNRNKRRFTQEEAVILASAAAKMAAERKEYKSVCLIGCNLKEQALTVCEQIKNNLNKDNIQAVILNNILYDAAAMKGLENAEGVLLVEKAGSTLYAEIAQELELLRRENIAILGGIIVE